VSRVVVVGGGHNGLTAAFYLAKAGLAPLVLEQSADVGGGATTAEIHPGFRCPVLAHHASLRADIADDMQLTRHGLAWLEPTVESFAPAIDEPPVVVYVDPRRTFDALRAVYPKDADAYPAYRSVMAAVSGTLAPLVAAPAPDINRLTGGDLWNLLKVGGRFRALRKRDGYRLLRWGPMPVADLVSEWFVSDVLRAMISGPAISGTMFGPRSAGSGLVLLLREAAALLSGPSRPVRGGPGALTAAMSAAARAAGAEIHTNVRVDRILTSDERAIGVVAGGREIPAAAVVSAVDPKTTFATLVDPAHLSPDFLSKIRGYRASGTLAKVNLALSALPTFSGLAESGRFDAEMLSGRVHLGPSLDYLERAFDHAKYGELSEEPWLDVTIPSILDPDLAPTGAHVMSVYVHYAPYRLRAGEWSAAKHTLLDRCLATLDRFAPGSSQLVVAAQVITPAELETQYGFQGGHIFHGELALDQLFGLRPVPGATGYRAPLRGLYLAGGGTHPGGFMSGGSGKLAAREVAKDLYS
jgi:phytoene dehydrogenase-like protein